jgi:hypothetical protein
MKKAPFVFFAVSVLAVFGVAFQDSVVRAISFVPLPAPKVAAATQTFVGEISDGQCAANGSHDLVMKKASVNSPVNCVRGCAKKHGLVLIDASSKTVYKLDNLAKVLPFAAQKATVTGTLDKATNTIHVISIAAGK